MLATRPNFDRIGTDREHDGYARGRGLGGERGGGREARDDHRNPTADQIGRERRQAVELIVRPAVLDGGVPALDEAGRTEPLMKALEIGRKTVSRGRAEKPDRGHCHLLRARSERPSSRRAAKQRDELAAHSIELHLLPQPGTSVAAYPIGEDQVRGSLQCGISTRLMTAVGQSRRGHPWPPDPQRPQYPQ